jgi:hypothetical protein
MTDTYWAIRRREIAAREAAVAPKPKRQTKSKAKAKTKKAAPAKVVEEPEAAEE